MKPLLIACLIAAATAAANAQMRTAGRIIRDDGALVITDGASYYQFKRDSSFDSGPMNGLSGRTITGRWWGNDDTFIIEGRWGWVNGMSMFDDYRRMTMSIQGIVGPGNVQTLLPMGTSVRVQSGYHTIDDMVRIPPPAGASRAASATTARAFREIRIGTHHMPGVDEVRWRVETTGCALEIDYPATRSASALAPSQVWLLRNDGTVIAPTRAAVMSGGGFGGTGAAKASYLYDCAVVREAVAVVVKLGDEYFIEPLRR